MDDAVDHGGGDDLVSEDVSPAGEGQVAGQDQRGVFVAGADELEEQVRGVLLEGDVADFVDLCRCRHSWIYAGPVIMPMRDTAGTVWPGEWAVRAAVPTMRSA